MFNTSHPTNAQYGQLRLMTGGYQHRQRDAPRYLLWGETAREFVALLGFGQRSGIPALAEIFARATESATTQHLARPSRLAVAIGEPCLAVLKNAFHPGAVAAAGRQAVGLAVPSRRHVEECDGRGIRELPAASFLVAGTCTKNQKSLVLSSVLKEADRAWRPAPHAAPHRLSLPAFAPGLFPNLPLEPPFLWGGLHVRTAKPACRMDNAASKARKHQRAQPIQGALNGVFHH